MKTSKVPRKGERVKLANIQTEFIVLTVRRSGSVVDLQLPQSEGAVMNDVPWSKLIYPDDDNA